MSCALSTPDTTLWAQPPPPSFPAVSRRSQRVTMDTPVTVVPPLPEPAERVPDEITKQFVRRPAKGWKASPSVPEDCVDDNAALWKQE